MVSMNVRGLADKVKRTQIFRYLREMNADIVCVQETHSVKKTHKIWQNKWGGKIVFSDGESNSRGVMIMFARNLNCSVTRLDHDQIGRWISLKVKIGD